MKILEGMTKISIILIGFQFSCGNSLDSDDRFLDIGIGGSIPGIIQISISSSPIKHLYLENKTAGIPKVLLLNTSLIGVQYSKYLFYRFGLGYSFGNDGEFGPKKEKSYHGWSIDVNGTYYLKTRQVQGLRFSLNYFLGEKTNHRNHTNRVSSFNFPGTSISYILGFKIF